MKIFEDLFKVEMLSNYGGYGTSETVLTFYGLWGYLFIFFILLSANICLGFFLWKLVKYLIWMLKNVKK